MKLMRNLLSLILLFSIFSCSALALEELPMIEASAYIAVETGSNTVLFEHNADEQLYPASVTKLLTALVACDHLNLDDIIVVAQEDVEGLYEQGSSVFLKNGEEVTFENMLKYLLVASGNDAANAIARTVGGSKEGFAEMMNQKAIELGCTGTEFTNPTGLPDDAHKTTARDIYLIAMEVLENPLLVEICGTAKLIFPATNLHDETTFYSTNHLISTAKDDRYFYEGATGMKTGWTGAAGMCLVATAERNDLNILTVVLGAPKREDGTQGSFTETTKLLDYCFANYKKDIFIPATEPICDVTINLAKKDEANLTLTLAEDYYDVLAKDTTREELSIVPLTDAEITAPVKKGDVLGTASIAYDGEIRATIDLIAANDVERSQTAYIFSQIKAFFSSLAFKIIIGVLLALIVILIVIRTINVRRKRRRRGGRYKR